MRANLRCSAAVNELSAAAGATPPIAPSAPESCLRARLPHGDVVGPHLDQRGDGELRAHHPPHEGRGRPPRHEGQYDEVVPLPQVRALVGEHGPHLVDVEAVQHARRDDEAGAQARQAVGHRDGVLEHAGARRGGPRRGEQVEQLAVPGANAQRAHRDGDEHAEQPRGQRRGEDERADVRDVQRGQPPGTELVEHRVEGGQGRTERRQPVDHPGAQQREAAREPDGLPEQQRPDRVAAGPAGPGQQAAHRFGERHAEHEQAERNQLHGG